MNKPNGASETITTVQGDELIIEPNVLTPKRTEYGKQIRKDYESGGVHERIGNMVELEPRTDGISNTLTSLQKDNYLAEPINTSDGVCRTIKAQYQKNSLANFFEQGAHGATGVKKHQGNINCYPRIRKLTPRECFRLMGVEESDIDKIQQSGVSNSQQYKMAGNSIVVDCLAYIFRNLLIGSDEIHNTIF